MPDQSPPADGDQSIPTTAKKLAEQTIDTASSVAELAVDIPVETAKALLDTAEKLVAKLKDVLD